MTIDLLQRLLVIIRRPFGWVARWVKTGLGFDPNDDVIPIHGEQDVEMLPKGFILLRFFYEPASRGRTLVFRLLWVFAGLYILGCVLTYFDKSIYIEGPLLGYLEDPGTPLLLLALSISTYLVYSLMERFKRTFGAAARLDESVTGLLISMGSSKHAHQRLHRLFTSWMVFMTRRDGHNKGNRWCRFLRIGAVILFLYGSLIEPVLITHTRTNWNFEYLISGRFFLGFLFNQVRDGFIYMLLIPQLLWMTLTIALATISIARHLQREGLLHIVPSAPDKTGGLHALGEISLVLFYIVIVQLIHLFPTSLILKWPPIHQIIYPPYFLFSVFVFFSPLLVVRKSMREAKRREMDKIMVEFYDLFGDLDKSMIKKKRTPGGKLERLAELLELNRDRYGQAASMAVWPYDFRTLARFATGISIPIALYLAELWIQESSILRNPGEIWKLLGF